MRHALLICLAFSSALFSAPFAAPAAASFSVSPVQDRAIVIKGGTVLTMAGAPIQNGTVVIRGGKIVAVGARVQTPAGAEVVDATGKYVMPGLIDAMTTIGVDNSDLNDVDAMTPQLRIIESFNPFGRLGEGKPGPI